MISRQIIIHEAAKWIGTPYRHQAALKGIGCDCLGLVRGVWQAVIGNEPEAPPPYTPDWAEARGEETLATAARRHMTEIDRAGMREGDVVLFRWRDRLPTKHAGILTAADRFIHAQQGAAVTEAALSPWWRRRIAFVFRFPGIED